MKKSFNLSADKKYIPIIENSENILREMCENKVRNLYDTISVVIQEQIDWEISSLKRSNDINLMLIFGKLINSEKIKPYVTNFAGTLSSSLISYLLGITNVNPLPPHYRCPSRDYSDFDTSRYNAKAGADLPDKLCPVCGKKLIKDGFNLHKEFEFGYEGGEHLSVTLNVPAVIRDLITNIIENMKEITAVANLPDKWLDPHCKSNDIHKIIIPEYIKECDIYSIDASYKDFNTENGYPFYDFYILKNNKRIDMLNYITTLGEMTATKPDEIPFNEKEVVDFFCNKILNAPYNGEISSILSEREFNIIKDCKPQNISDIIKCLALSYNKLWEYSVKDLIETGTASIKDIISTREDVYETLVSYGTDDETSFSLACAVYMGYVCNKLENWHKKLLHSYNIPQWYIDSCNNADYLFPRSHVAELFILKWKLAYYKLHYPFEFSTLINQKNNTV